MSQADEKKLAQSLLMVTGAQGKGKDRRRGGKGRMGRLRQREKSGTKGENEKKMGGVDGDLRACDVRG